MTLFGILLAALNFGHGLGERVLCSILDLNERPMRSMLLTSTVFESFHLVSGILSVFVSVFVLTFHQICVLSILCICILVLGVLIWHIVRDFCVLSLTWLSVLCVKCSQPVSLAPIDWKYPPRALVHPCPAFPMVSSGSRYLVFGSTFWGLVFDLRAQNIKVLPSYSTLHLLTLLFT